MNHIPAHFISADARPMTRRALAKLRTRQVVLDAAKRLFTQRGYEAATVRDIATEAGMSTGAVFANFNDKADLFNEVIVSDYEALAQRIRNAANGEATVEARLNSIFSVAYDFHLAQLPLLQAAVSVSWAHDKAAENRTREGVRQLLALTEQVLQRAVEAGELKKTIDTALVADLIWQGYIANYRLAVFDGWALPQLRERLARQIAVILAGFKA